MKQGCCPHGHTIKKEKQLLDGREWTLELRPEACPLCTAEVAAGAPLIMERYIEHPFVPAGKP